MITIYDINIDAMRECTQEDVDQMLGILTAMSMARTAIIPLNGPSDFSFVLAIFANPMRNDGVFVAENKPIEPYDAARGVSGGKLYPPTPKTPYKIGVQLDPAFAAELVRRWNLHVPKRNGEHFPRQAMR